MYVFDTSPFSVLFKNYYPNRFPSLWTRFDGLVANGQIISTREVLREVEDSSSELLRQWAVSNQALFTVPSAAEAAFVARVFAVPHFQHNIEKQKLLKGGRNADAFVIAKAGAERKTVVTMEAFKENGTKIPNICSHFGITCLSLEEFMEQEGWIF